MSDPESSPENFAKMEGGDDRQPMMANQLLSNSLGPDDPMNPQNWSLTKKVTTSFRAFLFAFTVALGLTSFTAGKVPFSLEFGLSPTIPFNFIAAFSLYLFGIAFAPYWAPHIIERVGRTIPYFVVLTLNALFNFGAGYSRSLAGVQVCRFFAGFFGGLTLVSLEGTFAEMWPAEFTLAYYSVQGLAGYFGAGFGPLIGGFLVRDSGGWRWTQYLPACAAAIVLLAGLGLPETYQREIPRRLAKQKGKTRAEAVAAQDPPQSGATFGAAFNVTVIQPVILFVTEPTVCLSAMIMFFTWATTFQFFISVPAALEPAPPNGPGFSIARTGLAFLTAIIGSLFAAATNIAIERVTVARLRRGGKMDMETMAKSVENRVIPAMIGIPLMTAGLFWVGNTIAPGIKPVVPIIGTAFFVWGSAMTTYSIVPYTFDLFQPAPTLGAITTQAVGRILAAGFLPFVILIDITALTPKWGFGVLGFISLIFWPMPFVLFYFGGNSRRKSKHAMM